MKRIILTGASSGLGASIARVFHEDGYEIIWLCRSKPADFVKWIETDLCSEDSVGDAVRNISLNYQDFSILMHCAGDGDAEEYDSITWKNTERMFDLNMIAPAILTSSLFPLIKKNETDIIGIGATIGFKSYKYFSMYGASKYAFRGWLENLQLELKGTKSRVIGFHPGGMDTAWNEKRINQIDDLSKKESSGKFMNPDDLARLVLQIVKLPKNMEVSEIIINRK